nr:MAG TPA: receptor binding protein [Caudoviricetes sp.]
MAKLTKFKAQQVEFPTHYEVEETNRGNNKIKSIVPAFGNIRENGTPETEEIYDGLQLGNVHTLQANKTTNLNIDYYVCNLDGLNEFGVNNDLKLRINVDSKNTNSTTKLRLNNNDYALLKEYNGNLKQIEAGDFKPNKTYELTYNRSQFVVINIDSRLNEIMGLEFGGNIQDTGDKIKGKCYFDSVTKFYYECIEDNSLTYNDSGKFRAISNKPISDKVEKLSNVETYVIDPRLTVGLIYKIGNICILILDSNDVYNGRSYGDVLFNIPEKFRPIFRIPVPVGLINSTSGGAVHIETDGNVIWRGGSKTISALYINAVYLAK